jgi:hypothetical protein
VFDNDTYDLVMCRECGFTCEHLSSHLKSAHGLKSQEYKEKHPGAPIICQRRNDNFRKNNPAKTDEFKKKHSERMSGENHPFYGKHHTEEMKKIISESLMGEKHPLYGKHHKEESRKKMSEKRQGEDNPMYGKAGFGGKKHTGVQRQNSREEGRVSIYFRV